MSRYMGLRVCLVGGQAQGVRGRVQTMLTQIRLPKLSASMQEGTIVEWLKSEGDRIAKGDPLCQVETDKAVTAVESPADGVLISIMKPASSRVPVNTIIAFVE